MTIQMHAFQLKIYCPITNEDLEPIIQQIFLSYLIDNILKGFHKGLLTGMILINF